MYHIIYGLVSLLSTEVLHESPRDRKAEDFLAPAREYKVLLSGTAGMLPGKHLPWTKAGKVVHSIRFHHIQCPRSWNLLVRMFS